MVVTSWLSAFANSDDLNEIQNAVERVESRTAGEIVPMVVRSSTLTGHVFPILLLFWLLFFIVLAPYIEVRVGGPMWTWNALALVLALIVAWVSSKSPIVQRLVTSHRDEALSVFHRAQLEFHQTGIPATDGRTGVLIFVSLKERRAVILGDKAISEKIKDETWVEIVNELVRHMGRGKLREAFTGAITRVGDVLAREFPDRSDFNSKNELPNALVVKE